MDFSLMTLDRTQPAALYLQLCTALENAISSGELVTGARLPSERDLARLLGVSRTTVVNAYQEMEARGLVRGHVGRGTFVCAERDPSGAPFAWRGKVSLGALRTEDSSLRWLARSAGDPELISFATAVAAREVFPIDAFRDVTDAVLRRHGVAAVGLGPTEGQPILRRAIANRTVVRPEQVLVLSGAQQGLDLIARCLLDPGDAVIVDRPGYLGAIQTFRSVGAHVIGWDVGQADFDELEDLLVRYRPKLLYTNPTFQNPTGQTMGPGERRELLELAARYRLPLVEDDPYSELGFERKPPPSLFECDEHHLVIHIGTFSKTLAGGLRLGWLAAAEPIVNQLALIKQRSDVSSTTLEQLVVSEFLTAGHFDRHLTALREEHKRRYLAMLAAIDRHLAPGALRYEPVEGGMYLWCRLGHTSDAQLLLHEAKTVGVIFINGDAFYADSGGRQQIRLCFSSVPPALIDAGIRRLAPILSSTGARPPAGAIPVAR